MALDTNTHTRTMNNIHALITELKARIEERIVRLEHVAQANPQRGEYCLARIEELLLVLEWLTDVE